ncbi:MAG: hypothetical protein KGM47_07630 [Acidobacteriota bacterium]|nr:hypothetical protein [Acidobacteriota bacterium]
MPDEILEKGGVGAKAEAAEAPCLRLRCKEMFIDMGTGVPFDLKDSGSGIYWCSHTQNCLGPDGQIVHFTCCTQGRGCYEAL